MTAVESALERALSAQLMQGGAKPRIDASRPAPSSFDEGDPGPDVFLVLDGVLRVERDGERLAEYGPGALLGERAHLEGGGRTSSGRRDAVPGRLGRRRTHRAFALEELSEGHRREERRRD